MQVFHLFQEARHTKCILIHKNTLLEDGIKIAEILGFE